MNDLPEKFQTAFEGVKGRLECAFANRRFRDWYDGRCAAVQHGKLLRGVYYAYSTQAQNACREGVWTVSQARQHTDAALPTIIDYYFERYFRRDLERFLGGESDRDLSAEEERTYRRQMTGMVIAKTHRWKRHQAGFVALAEGGSKAGPAGAPDSEAACDRSGEVIADSSSPSRVTQVDGRRIRKFMDEEGYINRTLAEKLGVSQRVISSMCNNGRSHGRPAVTKLANLMGVDVGDLFVDDSSSSS